MLLQDGKWNWNHVLVHSPELDLVCDHKAREQMFHTILKASHACFTLCQKNVKDHDWIQLPEPLIDEMNIPSSQYQWVRNLSLIFLNQKNRCKNCQIDLSFNCLPIDDINSPYLPGIRPPSKKRLPHLPHSLPLAEADEEADSSSETSDNDIDYGLFDDYHTAPIWTSNPPPLFDVWTFDSFGLQTLPNFASTWKDRGYRLLPYFAKVSQKESPTDFISRLLPTIKDAPQSSPINNN